MIFYRGCFLGLEGLILRAFDLLRCRFQGILIL